MQIQPTSILDVGVGFGKWGHLAREYLDVWGGRFRRQDFQVEIDGIEAFGMYLAGHQSAIYDDLYTGDARVLMVEIPRSYDVVLAMDCIEHQAKQEAEELLRLCVKKARRAAIVSIPLGEAWLGANSSYAKLNPWEAHRSAWTHGEVLEAARANTLYQCEVTGVRGPIGIFALKGGAKE